MHVRCSDAYEVTYIEIDNRQREVLINMQNKLVERCYKHANKYYKAQCEKNLSNNLLIFAVEFHINILVIESIKHFVKWNCSFLK
jgi:hypothetical protein